MSGMAMGGAGREIEAGAAGGLGNMKGMFRVKLLETGGEVW